LLEVGGVPGGVRQCSGKRYERRIRPFRGARKGRGAACALDLEGVVGKWANGTYQTDGRCTSWVKFKNPEYSQMEARHGLFEGFARLQQIETAAAATATCLSSAH
jgi:hypothetical protein